MKFAALTDTDPRMWDMEGLLWSGLYLLASLQKKKGVSYGDWVEKRFLWLSNAPLTPKSEVVRSYFSRADQGFLIHPSDCWKVLQQQCSGGSTLIEKVRAVEKREKFFPCPEILLQRLSGSIGASSEKVNK